MSDQPEQQEGTSAEVTGSAAAWPEPAESPAWVNIAAGAGPDAPGPAGPGASPEVPEGVAGDLRPATEAGRSRRPTSLRDQYLKSDEDVPRRTLTPPAFPSAPSFPGSRVSSPVSEPEQPGNPDHVEDPAPGPDPAPPVAPSAPGQSLKERLPLDKLGKLPLDKLSPSKPPTGKLPTEKLPTEKLPLDRVRSLTKQRPEVGVGLAFAGGLVIATILKRLGRR